MTNTQTDRQTNRKHASDLGWGEYGGEKRDGSAPPVHASSRQGCPQQRREGGEKQGSGMRVDYLRPLVAVPLAGVGAGAAAAPAAAPAAGASSPAPSRAAAALPTEQALTLAANRSEHSDSAHGTPQHMHSGGRFRERERDAWRGLCDGRCGALGYGYGYEYGYLRASLRLH
jgi:hypothetical protein